MDVDVLGSGETQSRHGQPGPSYDDTGAVASDMYGASGTYSAGASGGSDGTAGGVESTIVTSVPSGSSSPSVPLTAASSSPHPLVLPIRADLETVKRMMKGDTYIGRGCKQRGLSRSVFGNPYKLCNHSRSQAVAKYRRLLDESPELCSQLINLSGHRLLCHCKRSQQCHADAIIAKFAELYPGAYDRDSTTERVPTSEELNLLATLRQEPSSDEGSSADEGVPGKDSGWVGSGPPMRVGVGYTARDICDGQGLPSPGRWAIPSRRYPASSSWKTVTRKFEQFSAQYGTPELLMNLALGRVQENPFCEKDIRELKQEIISELEQAGLELKREENDRRDVPIDFRYLDLLLRAAEDPEVGLGQFSQGVRVGPSARMPRLPALYKPKKEMEVSSADRPLELLRGRGILAGVMLAFQLPRL